MPAEMYEVLTGLRIILFLGALFVGIILFVDLMGDGPKTPSLGVQKRIRPIVEEECKLHARKLKDCPPGSHDQPEDGSPDDS